MEFDIIRVQGGAPISRDHAESGTSSITGFRIWSSVGQDSVMGGNGGFYRGHHEALRSSRSD